MTAERGTTAEITAIRARRRDGGTTFAVELDGRPWVVVDEVALLRLGWYVGRELDDDVRRDGERAAQLGATERRAARLLASRPHARRELEAKLSRSGGPDAAREVAGRLAEHGLLDDDAYAARVAARRLAQGYGPARIAADLQRAGVPGGIVRAVLASLDREAVLDAARAAVGPAPDPSAWRRLVARGFDPEVADDVVGVA